MVEEVEATGFFFVFAQLSHALGNKAEMEITSLLEHNPSLMRLGLFFEFNDARSRVATLLQKNLDRSKWATEPKLVKKKKEKETNVTKGVKKKKNDFIDVKPQAPPLEPAIRVFFSFYGTFPDVGSPRNWQRRSVDWRAHRTRLLIGRHPS